VSDEQLNALVAYIKSLGQPQPKQAAGSSVAADRTQPPTPQVD
jgi:cytochrome c1